MSTLKTVYRLLLYSLPLLVAIALYGYTIRLPFFLDDAAHFLILTEADGFEFWGNFPTFPFYRPIAFTIWQAYATLTGTFDPVAFHMLNVFCFGIAGVLIGQIVRRVLPDDVRVVAAVTAGVGFVVFPFSYQAVAMVAALFHLLLALGVTASMWWALLWLDGRAGTPALVMCWLFTFIAVFSHENGVLLLPLFIGLIAIVYYGNLPSRRRLFLLMMPIVLIVAIYLILWISFRPQGSTALSGDFTTSLAALLQGLIYPVAAILRPFIDGDLSPLPLLLIVTLVIGIAIAVILRWSSTSRLWRFGGFALGWYLLGILPAVMFLSPGYVLGQLRLALFASIGGAMLWGVLAAVFWISTRERYRLLVIGAIIGCIFISLDFLIMRRESFLNLHDYNVSTLNLFQAYNVAQHGAVLVNAPDFITPLESDRRFLLGSEGVLFVDPTMNYGSQFSINADADYDSVDVIAYRHIQRNEGYGYTAHPPELETAAVVERVRNAPYVFVTRFAGERFYPELVGGTQLAISSGGDEADVIFAGGDFILLEATMTINEGQVVVETWWQVDNPAPVKMFVHIYCDDTFIAQSDGYPWGDTYPFQFWNTGEIQVDRRTIPVDSPQACLRSYTGLYYEVDVTRLEATDTLTNDRLENDQYLIEQGP